MKIAIITPTYNRDKLLGRLYTSLVSQTDDEFVWIVVDDGSTDKTEELINSFSEQMKVKIRYYKKNNGGKSAALNYGFECNPDIDFFAVVDSDDWLLENAIDTIKNMVDKYANEYNVGAIFFKYLDCNGKPLYSASDNCLKEEMCLTRYEHDSQYKKEDGCIGYYSRVTKKYRYPEFESEKYMGPIVIQLLMADEYKIAFTQTVIGFADYQPGGLSKSGRKLRLNNPLGMILYCGLLQSKMNTSIKSRIKYCIEAQAYMHVAKLSIKTIEDRGISNKYIKRWACLPGMLLGLIWMKKYGK